MGNGLASRHSCRRIKGATFRTQQNEEKNTGNQAKEVQFGVILQQQR
jgi:hypothetical protein